ncbi:T9SS-dependent choice-of-anchor J family protein [Flavobacterium microcysteis]|uniref:T9SS type A sorting domain-containing protein n=1 Tax=Flavobacterium microcysteis TaxID=2596891 RepID=A0A501PZ98_9FLAO|nr:T9SS type A sorting domain-containing protein [Flavobacterium microcysteis]TPD65900.1 T9SS type A sorting domain-containing protein [Flavobacterium microcysteis]
MKKTLLSVAFFFATFISNAQCNPVVSFSESFENFTNGPVSQNCWTGSTAPKLSVATVSGNKMLQAYSYINPTEPFYIVSPELTSIDGNQALSFTAQPATGSAPGNMLIQIGTMTSATDFGSFVEVGTPFTVSASQTSFSLNIPASNAHKFIAFRIVADAQHVASLIDNINYQPNLSIDTPIANTFKVYPNPSADKKITIAGSNLQNDTSVIVYTLTGAKVYETVIESNSTEKTLYLSDLSAGTYILKLQSGDYSTTKKLILK